MAALSGESETRRGLLDTPLKVCEAVEVAFEAYPENPRRPA